MLPLQPTQLPADALFMLRYAEAVQARTALYQRQFVFSNPTPGGAAELEVPYVQLPEGIVQSGHLQSTVAVLLWLRDLVFGDLRFLLLPMHPKGSFV